MLNNVQLFNECLEHPAKNVDSVARETLNNVILPIDDSIPCELLSRNTKLLELDKDNRTAEEKALEMLYAT